MRQPEPTIATAVEGEMGPAAQGTLGAEPGTVELAKAPRRFYGTVRVNPLRLTSEAGTIGREVVQHLQALLGANVQVTLDIEADISGGIPDQVVRIVSENAKTLKFDNFGFEEE